jgi:hypothetical protein
MHHIGACHGRGEGREDSEGRDGEALQGAQEEEHGGEEATDGGDMARGEETWEECGDGVELTRGERLRRRLGGWSRHTDPVDGVNEGSAPGASERRREAGQWVWRGGVQHTGPPMRPAQHPHQPRLHVTLRGRHRQDLRHPRRSGVDGPQHPARCSLHEDRERNAAFLDLLYYAILVIPESSRFSSDLLRCLVAIVIVNSKYQSVAIALVNSKICARELKLL